MPYIGRNHIAGDHTSNFKVLDDISSYTATFDGSSTNVVSTANETLRIVEHRFIQGQRVTYTNGGGGNIGGLTTGTAYFVTFDTHNTIKLATTLANANSNTNINLSSVGSGSSHTLTAAFDGVNQNFKATHSGGSDVRINNSTQLQIAINNVIQKPNNISSYTEGFRIVDSEKIQFKTAPTSNDVFWGTVIANTIETFDISDNKVDNLTGDGSTTEFNLSSAPPSNNSIVVTINGVVQHPSDANNARAYSLNNQLLIFTSAPANGDEIQVRHIGFAGASTGDVTGFYGRVGNVVLGTSDNISVGNVNVGAGSSIAVGTGVTIESNGQATYTGVVTALQFKGDGSNLTGIDATALKDTSGNVKIQAQASGAVYTGVHTFTTLKSTSADFSGSVSIGGTLTYEDVTNIDSVGVITARDNIKVGTGVTIESNGQATFVGVVTFGSGSTTIDNNVVNVGTALTLGHTQGFQFHTQNLHSAGFEVNQINVSGASTIGGNLDANGDLDVDGHTNLDNVSIAGVTTGTTINATTFVGALTGTASGNPTLTSGANDRIITATGANTIQGESTLTYGTSGQLKITRAAQSNVGLYVFHSDGNEIGHFGNIGSGNEGILALKDGGTDTVILNGETGGNSYINSGKVGIGTVNPNAPLDVFSNISATNKDLFMVRSATGAFAVQCSNITAANPEWRLRTYSNEPIVVSPGNVERLRITSAGVLNVPAGIGPQLRFENQHSVTTDAAISTFDDATGTLLCLGSNFYMDSSGAETRYNTSEESTGIILNRQGYINLNTGGTGATAVNRIQITETGKVQIGLPGATVSLPGGTEVVNIRAMDEGNLHVRNIGNLMSAPSGSGVGLDVLNNAGNAVKDLCIRGAVVAFRSATAETLRITSAGTVNIGESSTQTSVKLHVDSGTTNNATVCTLRNDSTSAYATNDGGINTPLSLYSDGTNAAQSVGIQFYLSKSGETGCISEIGATRESNGNSTLVFRTRDSSTGRNERLRITSGGRLTLSNSEGIQLSAKVSGMYALDGALSYYSNTNGVYLNGAGSGGWLRLNASGVNNDRTSINLIGHTASSGDTITFKTNSTERLRIGNDGGTTFTGQRHMFNYSNSGGVGPYLTLRNTGNAVGSTTGIVFGIGTSNADLDGSDYGEGQIKVDNDSGGFGNMHFNLHVNANRSFMKIVGNGQNYGGASAGSEGQRGGVAFGNAGIAIDRSWMGQPGIHVFNQNVEGDTDQGTFRFHGWNTTYATYPGRSGADFSVNLVADGSGLTSDERRKTGITTITNALDTITKMRGVSFQFVNRELDPQTHMSMDNGKKLGFIAQEVIPLLPQLILDSGEKNVPLENGWCDRYSMDYAGVTAVLVEAIKELKSKNEALEARLAALEGS